LQRLRKESDNIMDKYKNVSGVILAGGQNTRMGEHKAFIEIDSKRIIDRILDILHKLFEEVVIVTNDAKRFSEFKNVLITEDLIKGCGPLSGIHTGLESISFDKAFFVACDMPFLHIEFIKRLVEYSLDNNEDCIIPRSENGIDPLHAIYFKRILPRVHRQLNTKEFSLSRLLRLCKCHYMDVPTEEMKSLTNVNTKEELEEIETV